MRPGSERHAFISLGANLPSRFGGPAATLRLAVERLRTLSDEPLRVSSLWNSSPVDCPPGSPNYHNAVVGLVPRAAETPLSLLHALQGIEQGFGRTRTGQRNEPRVLDLDLLTFGQARCASPELVLPHPRATERLFVLLPLREVASAHPFPGQSRSLDDLIADAGEQPVRRIVWPDVVS